MSEVTSEKQAVQTQTNNNLEPAPTFAGAIQQGRSTFKKMYGEDAEKIFLREYGFAIMQAKDNPKLAACEIESVKNAIIQIALTGLTLSPVSKHAYLVPRKGKCCLDVSYLGMIDILLKSNSVKGVDTGVIFKGEKFEYRKGDDSFFSHTPDLMLDDDSEANAIAAYMTAYLNGEKITYLLRKKEILSHKNVSQSSGSNYSPWNGEFWQSMYIKTVVRHAYKFLPRTEQADKIIEILNEANPVEFNKPDPVPSYE